MCRTAQNRIYGSQAAKPNLALPAAGGSAGVRSGGIERAKAGAEDFGGDADAGKPGVVHQQQWKGRAYFAVCDASATGYVCGKGACDGGTDGQERASDSGIGCKGCSGDALRGEGQAAASAGRSAHSEGRGENRRCGEGCGRLSKSPSGARPVAEESRGAAAADQAPSCDAGRARGE